MTPMPSISENEEERHHFLLNYEVLINSIPEEETTPIAKLASYICQTPIALLFFSVEGKQWYKTQIGLKEHEEITVYTFCEHAILGEDVFEVSDALADVRFRNSPVVKESPYIRFYAGMPLVAINGQKLGTLCVLDKVPRSLSEAEKEALRVLARQVITHLEVRKQNLYLKEDQQTLGRKRKMLQAISAATDELLSNQDYYDAIGKCLPILGEAVEADRVYVSRTNPDEDDNLLVSVLYQWDTGNSVAQPGEAKFQNLPLSYFEDIIEIKRREEFKAITSKLPEGSFLRSIFEEQGVKSSIQFPVFYKSILWGFIGFTDHKNERNWLEGEVSLLRSFANTISNAVERAETAKEVYEMALFPMENPEPVMRIDRKGKVILKNHAAEGLKTFIVNDETYTDEEFYRLVANLVSEDEPSMSLEVTDDNRVLFVVARLLENSNYINIYTNDITRQKETEHELGRLSMVARTNTKGVLFITVDGEISWCNYRFTEIARCTYKDIKENNSLEVFFGPQTQQDKIVEIMQSLLSGKSIETELVLYRKDGNNFWADVKVQPLLNEKGRLKEFFAMVEDIDEKKKAEELLKKSETRLSAIIQNLQDGIIIKDENRKVVFANKKFYELFNLVETDVVPGDDYLRINGKVEHLLQNPDSYFKRIDEIVQAGKIVLGEELELFDGRILEREYIPIYIDNVYRGHVWKYSDVTESRNYERNLKAQEEKYRNIIANMNLGLVEVDLQGVILDANNSFSKSLGYRLDEVVGKNISLIFSKRNIRNNLNDDDFDLDNIPENNRLPVLNKRGELRWWLISRAPNYNDKGEHVGYIIINLDITEHQRLQDELSIAKEKAEESFKARERFLANMSHEIRTPLNAVVGMVRELSKEVLSERQQLYIKHAISACEHLLSLVNDILDISKIAAGGLNLELRTFSLREVIDDLEAIMSPAAEEKMLKFEVDFDENIAPALLGDSNRVRQILLNLVSNAIKFTEKGSVTVTCKSLEKNRFSQKVKLQVADTGVGIEKGYLKDIFNIFSQEDASTARKHGGTGLGMNITHELVQLMNGNIEISSTKGAGTIVQVLLCFEVGDEKELERPIIADDFEQLKNLKVLLVEDNELNRMVAFNSLQRYDIDVTEATNGIEAVEKVKASSFDLILMDLQMPLMDGIEATKIIRNELQVTTPIIAFTANAFKNEINQHLASGMNGYVTKPFEEKVLIGTIQRILGQTVSLNRNSTENSFEEPSEKLYSLSKLIEVSHGDTVFIKKMLDVFVSSTTSSILEIKDAFAANDYDTIRKAAHRIKPGIDKLNIMSLKHDIRLLEQFDAEVTSKAELQTLITRVEDTVNKVVAAIAQEKL